MLKKKTFLITGSSSGIGRSVSENLLQNGAKVIGLSRNKSKVEKSKNYFHYEIDLSDLKKNYNEFINILLKYDKIDGFISNAGNGAFQSLENFSPLQIDQFVKLNLTSHIILTRALIPHLKKRKSGNIIFIG